MSLQCGQDLAGDQQAFGGTMNSKPPVFIAVKTRRPIGDVVTGYVRAEQIESIFAEDSFNPRTRIRMFSGLIVCTDEALDQVFAKMADALNIEVES